MGFVSLSVISAVVLWAVRAQSDIPNDLSAHFTIDEESSPSSYVGNIAQAAGLQNVFNSATLAKLEFGFIPGPGGDSDYFRLDPKTGDLRTLGEIDREDLCPGEEQCHINSDVAIVSPGDMFQVISIQVTIADINDQPPVFTPSRYQVAFSESDPVGTSRSLPVAMDMDSPHYGVREYRLGMSVNEFQLLQVDNPINGLLDLKLVVTAPLDRETRDSYQVLVEALDSGVPPLVGNLVIDVTVEDDNDHSPRFQNSLYEIDVGENFPTRTGFFTITATDNDQGENADIVYDFSPRTGLLHGDLFSIDQTTGELSLNGELDFEDTQVYHLEVTATDRGSNPQSSVTTVKVRVLDVNDNFPGITISTLTEKTHAEIPENLPKGKFTAHVSVVDADSEENGEVVCLLTHPMFELKLIRQNMYKIVTSRDLDREATDRYLLTVQCSDLGNPSLSATENITVIVLDQNDNPPRLSQLSYAVTVPENLAPDTYILHVTATDDDIDANAELSFTILQRNVSEFIAIDPATGTVNARKLLDYEEVQEMRFTVRVSDAGSPPLTTDVPVIIQLEDSNDNAPHFSSNHYVFYIAENESPQSYVGRVQARDADAAPYNIFDYSLTKQNPSDRDMFYVDSSTGSLYTTGRLDHEDQSLYYLSIHATDLDNANFVGSCSVTVYVEDRNDNPPVIHFPLDKNATFPISNKVPVSYNITKIFATDPDSGSNGNITYRLVAGNDADLFRIDRTHGFIQTNTALEAISYEEHKLIVRISDEGETSLHTDVTLKVVVDETVPYFTEELPSAIVQKTNLTIIIIVAAVSGFIIVILIIAIVVLKTTDCRRSHLLRHHSTDKGARVFSDLNVKAIEANGYLNSQSAVVTVPGPQSHHQLSPAQTDTRPHQGAGPAPDIVILRPDVLHKLDPEVDSHSVSSADLSNTDSGRGASEEGGEHRQHLPRSTPQRSSQYSTRAPPPAYPGSHHGYQPPYIVDTTAPPTLPPHKPYHHGNTDSTHCAVHGDTRNAGAHGYHSNNNHGNTEPTTPVKGRHGSYEPTADKYHQGSHRYNDTATHVDTCHKPRAGPKRVIHAVNV